MEYRKIKDEDKDEDAISDDIDNLRGKALLGVPVGNMATLGSSSSEQLKWKRKSIVTLALTVLTSSQAILIVWSKRAGKYDYSVTTANFMVEALKCALSLAALVRIWRNEGVTDDNRLSTTLDEVSVYPIPAALYLIKNLLQYYIFAYVDAPGYQILKNLNIISTGVLYRIILERKLSEIQWAAFILLCAGCTTAQLNPSSDRVLQTPFEGWVMAIVMALLSGFAGVYTEAIIKKRPSRNINVQNFWLYVFGMGFNAIAILIQDFDVVMNKGFFHGYSLITTLMILNHALSGIAVSMVMKYADNIVKMDQYCMERKTYSLVDVVAFLTLSSDQCVFYFSGNAADGSCFCVPIWVSSLPRLFPWLHHCVCLSIFTLCWEGTKIVMTLRLSQIALSMYRLIFCNIFVSVLFFQLIFLNLPVQSICVDDT